MASVSNLIRLIDVHTFELKAFTRYDVVPEYAILSHMWHQGEITFNPFVDAYKKSRPENSGHEYVVDEIHKDREDRKVRWKHLLQPTEETVPKKSSWGKIAWACKEARDNEVAADYLWIDTCCIDKSDKTEESEAISSMARWYAEAKVCYTYLEDVSQDLSKEPAAVPRKTVRQPPGGPLTSSLGPLDWSRWFDRGWTLQELLAPTSMQIFDHEWRFINTKENLIPDIHQATGISEKFLATDAYKQACVAVKMSWMATRTTTKIEDTAYALLGLLDIRMQTDYGEGPAAFIRLQQTLIQEKKRQDESIFAWTDPTSLQLPPKSTNSTISTSTSKSFGLLAPWPTCFARSSCITTSNKKHRKDRIAYSIQNEGVLFHLPSFFPDHANGADWNNRRAKKRNDYALSLNCWIEGKEDSGDVTIDLARDNDDHEWRRVVDDDLIIAISTRTSQDKFIGLQKTRPAHIPHYPQLEESWATQLARSNINRDSIEPVEGQHWKLRRFRQALDKPL